MDDLDEIERMQEKTRQESREVYRMLRAKQSKAHEEAQKHLWWARFWIVVAGIAFFTALMLILLG
jgi:hypothetical protein